MLQVPVWAQAPLAAALATPVSLLMINGALSYNTHVLDKAGRCAICCGADIRSPNPPFTYEAPAVAQFMQRRCQLPMSMCLEPGRALDCRCCGIAIGYMQAMS